jgi:hypothetical protein
LLHEKLMLQLTEFINGGEFVPLLPVVIGATP